MMTKEELTERAQLVRIHEANCHIPYPTPIEGNFRLAIMKKLAAEYGLKEYRGATVVKKTPSTNIQAPAAARSSGAASPAAARSFGAASLEKHQAANRKNG
jgi:sialic acid synthase SpsE